MSALVFCQQDVLLIDTPSMKCGWNGTAVCVSKTCKLRLPCFLLAGFVCN